MRESGKTAGQNNRSDHPELSESTGKLLESSEQRTDLRSERITLAVVLQMG